MEDMKKILEEVQTNLDRFGKEWPADMGAFSNLLCKIEESGALDCKTKELISVSLSVVTQCKWCIAYHVKGALDQGATRKEIMESAWTAVLMGGGPSLMHAQLVEKALDDFGAQD